MSDTRIADLISLAVEAKSLLEYHVEFKGKTGKGDGYLGKVSFITVSGKTKNGEKKCFDLIVKTSTENKLLRSQIPIKQLFLKENYVYDEVIPAFRKFRKTMESSADLELSPFCYLTKSFEDSEAIVLEDLKVKGFDVWDRKRPMSDDHVKLVLEAYGKWHAFSLALWKKQPEAFVKLTEKNPLSLWACYINKVKLHDVLFLWCEQARKYWENDKDLAEFKFTKEEIVFFTSKSFLESSDRQVVLHADCWTNNFMFKTEENSTKPVKVKIIDWQMSGFGSPILDLAMFIYTCVNTEIHQDVKQLLKIYYDSLSQCLTQLQCNPKTVLSWDLLLNHWKNYSKCGLILGGIFLLKFSLSESEEAPDFVETAECGDDFLKNFEFKIANEKNYYKRVKDNIIHYVNNSI